MRTPNMMRFAARAGACVMAACLAAAMVPLLAAPAPAQAVEKSAEIKVKYWPLSWLFTMGVSGAGSLELVDVVMPDPPIEEPPFEEVEPEGEGGGDAPAPRGAALRAGAGDLRAVAASGPFDLLRMTPDENAVPGVIANPAQPGMVLRNSSQEVLVARGSMLVFQVAPDEGAHLQSLFIGDTDVTHMISADGRLSLPAEAADATLVISFSEVVPGADGPAGLLATGDPLAWSVLVALAVLAAMAIGIAALKRRQMISERGPTLGRRLH